MSSIYATYPKAVGLMIDQRMRDADHERLRRLARHSRPSRGRHAGARHLPW